MIKKSYNLYEVGPNDKDNFVKWYYETSVKLSKNVEIPISEIYIYEDNSPNVFATGASKKVL